MSRAERTKSDATQACGRSPTKNGLRGVRETTSAHWFQGEGIAVQGLRTPQGQLNYRLQRSDKQLVLDLQAGLVPPPGGVVLPWPYSGDPGEATINGEPAEWNNRELRVHQLPARIEIDVPSAVRRAERKGQ